jgi:hypothetical protein
MAEMTQRVAEVRLVFESAPDNMRRTELFIYGEIKKSLDRLLNAHAALCIFDEQGNEITRASVGNRSDKMRLLEDIEFGPEPEEVA